MGATNGVTRRAGRDGGARRGRARGPTSPAISTSCWATGRCSGPGCTATTGSQVDNYAAWAEAELTTLRRQVDHLLVRFGDCSAELEISRRLLADAPRGREDVPGLRPGAGDAPAGRRRGGRADRGRGAGGRARCWPRRGPRPTPGCARPTRSRRWRSWPPTSSWATPAGSRGRGRGCAGAGPAEAAEIVRRGRSASGNGSPPRRAREREQAVAAADGPAGRRCRPRWTTSGGQRDQARQSLRGADRPDRRGAAGRRRDRARRHARDAPTSPSKGMSRDDDLAERRRGVLVAMSGRPVSRPDVPGPAGVRRCARAARASAGTRRQG